MAMWLASGLLACLAVIYASYASSTTSSAKLPPQSVLVDPLSFAVLGANGPFRDVLTPFNPTNTTAPFFQIFNNDFLAILGNNPSIHVIAENDTFAFAHEAPIWMPDTDEVFFASNDGGALGMSDLNHNNQYSFISLKDAENLGKGQLVKFTKLPLDSSIQMTNGGTPFRNQLLLVNSGRGPLPPNIAIVNHKPPFNSTIILDNFFGRQFNSLNDVKIHPQSKAIFFTDTIYGFLNNFRPPPELPIQVYRLDPDTGDLRVVADQFNKCNGIAFSPDGNTAFVTDTGVSGGFMGFNQTLPATIYAYDVDPVTQMFKNRRVFAYTDNGVPDGIELDSNGNVYSGCGDGIQVWNPSGELIGKFFLNTTSANLAFAGQGRLVIMAETKIFLANIAATGMNLLF